MRYSFPRTLKAAEASDRAQWPLADALLKETDKGASGPRSIRAAAKELADNGIDLSPEYLAHLRYTAEVFPANRRLPLPWKVHYTAGNPDMLDSIVKDAKKSGTKVTIWHVEAVLKQIRRDEQKARDKAKAEAERERAKAEEAERKARERERAAKDAEERRERARERKAAEAKTREAKKKVKDRKSTRLNSSHSGESRMPSSA